MKNFFSIIKEAFGEVKDFFIKAYLTTKYVVRKFFYFLKVVLLWIRYYVYQFFNLIYYVFVSLIDGIKWLWRKIKDLLILIVRIFKNLFRFIYQSFLKLFRNLWYFIKCLGSKLKSFLKWILIGFKKLIFNFHYVILVPIFILIVIVIAFFNTILIFLRFFLYSLLNVNYLLDDDKVIAVKPLYLLPVNLIKGYSLSFKRLTNKKKKIISEQVGENFASGKDMINVASVGWLSTLGIVLLASAVIVTLPIALVAGTISVVLLPKDETKFLTYFKKRIIVKKTGVENSFKLKPVNFGGYKISWVSKNPEIISNEGIFNSANVNLIKQDIVSIGFIVEISKNTVNSFEIEVPVNFSKEKDALLSTHKNIILPKKINHNINFYDFKTSPEIRLEVESMNPKIINNDGVILKASFKNKMKVNFLIKLFSEEYYMKKRVSTYIYDDDAQKYLEKLVENTPSRFELRKGKIKLVNSNFPLKWVSVNFSADEKRVINKMGKIYRSNYDIENRIEVTYSIDDLSLKKNIILFRKGDKKGLMKELQQIEIPKVRRDDFLIDLPKVTKIGKDGFSYQITWYHQDKEITSFEINPVIKKTYIINLIAKINVNGIDGFRNVKIAIPRRSSKFGVQYDLDSLEPLIVSENRLYLPKSGKHYGSKVFWISKTPDIISSKGVLRKPHVIERSKKKEAVITAVVLYRTKDITKDFVFEIKDNKFKDYNLEVVKLKKDSLYQEKLIKVDAVDGKVDLSILTIEELKELAKHCGLKTFFQPINKKEIIDVLVIGEPIKKGKDIQIIPIWLSSFGVDKKMLMLKKKTKKNKDAERDNRFISVSMDDFERRLNNPYLKPKKEQIQREKKEFVKKHKITYIEVIGKLDIFKQKKEETKIHNTNEETTIIQIISEDGKVDLSILTIEELKAFAEKRKITNYDIMDHDELVASLPMEINSLRLDELKALAKYYKIKNFSTMRKNELVEVLVAGITV